MLESAVQILGYLAILILAGLCTLLVVGWVYEVGKRWLK